jgi:sugar phosphate permease
MSRTGRYRLTSLLAGTLELVGVGMLLFGPPSSSLIFVSVAFLLVSMGTSFGGPTFMIVYQNAIPRSQLGAGIGLLSLFRQFGASVGTALVGSVVGSGTLAANGADIGSFVQQAALLPFLASLCVLLASWFMANHPLRSAAHDMEESAATRRTMSPPQPLVKRT